MSLMPNNSTYVAIPIYVVVIAPASFFFGGNSPDVGSKNLMWSANAIHYLMSPQCLKMDENSFTCKCELYQL